MNPWSGKRGEEGEEPLNALIFKVMERVCPLNTRCDDEKTSCTPDKPQTANERARLYLLASLSAFFNTPACIRSWPQRECVRPARVCMYAGALSLSLSLSVCRLIIFFRRQQARVKQTR